MFRANLTSNGKFQKNRKKQKKKSKETERDGKQKLSFHFVPTRHVKKKSKKIEKKFQKFKNTVVASFQAVIGWNRPRNKENKNYHSVSSKPDA